jgi:hypothetical protein
MGPLSLDAGEFTISEKGSLRFDLDDIDVASCTFDEELSKPAPTPIDAECDVQSGISFSTLRLSDGTKIFLKRIS